MSEVLRLDGVSKTYGAGRPGEVRALACSDLVLPRGVLAGLVAPSGAGKTTLLHIAGLLDRPSSGRVMLFGQETGALDDKARTRLRRDQIGFVYQFHHLLPEFSALENVMLPQRAAGVAPGAARTRAAALLDAVGLAARQTHRPEALSGGEQQRVALARALANRPALLLADEPTGNLDPETSERVFDMLVRVVRASGLAALIATHNTGLAARMDVTYRLGPDGLHPV